MISLAVLLEIKKNGTCYGIRCDDCPLDNINRSVKKSGCYRNPLEAAEKELSRYTEEELFDILL